MKLCIKSLTSLFLIAFLACSEAEKEKLLVGKWAVQFDKKACLANMQKEEKKIFEAQPQAQKDAILKEIAAQIERDSWVEFKADHSFEQVLLEGETKYNGTWEIKSGGTLLLKWLKNPKEKNTEIENCQILTLDANALQLKIQSPETPKLTYKRLTKNNKNNPKTLHVK